MNVEDLINQMRERQQFEQELINQQKKMVDELRQRQEALKELLNELQQSNQRTEDCMGTYDKLVLAFQSLQEDHTALQNSERQIRDELQELKREMERIEEDMPGRTESQETE